ncbi:MAG: glycosyltransferase family 25 protein [Planctomycetaceae bacterium]|nr:glycosyltransferase family 25 protein [Planctomycetaceae bacterium]
MAAEAFIISLQRATARFEHAATLLPLLPFAGSVLPAVDGKLLNDQFVQTVYRPGLREPTYPFRLSAGEIGCFLSHRAAWQQIVTRRLEGALVLEDDVAIDPNQLALAVQAAREVAVAAYVQLPVRPLPVASALIHRTPHCEIVRPVITPLRTSGQWVSNEAAVQLLDVTSTFDRPVDTTLQMHWETGVRLLAVTPSGIRDQTQQLGGSTIGAGRKNRSLWDRLSREYRRTAYRSRIARLSRRHFSEVGDARAA